MSHSVPLTNDSSVVIHRQNEISVFANGGGGITIRSVNELGHEELVAFGVQYAQAIKDAIDRAVIDIESLDEE